MIYTFSDAESAADSSFTFLYENNASLINLAEEASFNQN